MHGQTRFEGDLRRQSLAEIWNHEGAFDYNRGEARGSVTHVELRRGFTENLICFPDPIPLTVVVQPSRRLPCVLTSGMSQSS